MIAQFLGDTVLQRQDASMWVHVPDHVHIETLSEPSYDESRSRSPREYNQQGRWSVDGFLSGRTGRITRIADQDIQIIFTADVAFQILKMSMEGSCSSCTCFQYVSKVVEH